MHMRVYGYGSKKSQPYHCCVPHRGNYKYCCVVCCWINSYYLPLFFCPLSNRKNRVILYTHYYPPPTARAILTIGAARATLTNQSCEKTLTIGAKKDVGFKLPGLKPGSIVACHTNPTTPSYTHLPHSVFTYT